MSAEDNAKKNLENQQYQKEEKEQIKEEQNLDIENDSEYEEVVEELEEEEEEEESYSGESYSDNDEEEISDYDYYEDEEEEQENLLTFTTFPLDDLQGQHIMIVAAFNRFIIVGTNRGVVALLEPTGTVFKIINNHVDPISDVSCDISEEYIGSCDKAGLITVLNLYDERDFYRREFDVPIQSISLHPKFNRQDERPIIIGGGDKVILITKTMFLGHRKVNIIQERRGKVYVVRWCGPDIIAWANDRGIQLYSYTGKSLLQHIPRPSDSPQLELYRCSLIFEFPNTLICGWGDWVQVVNIFELRMEERLRWGTEFMSRTHKIEISPAIRTNNISAPCRVCGIAPFGLEKYLILACTVEQEGCMKELEVRIVERETFNDIYRGRLHTKYSHPLQFSLAFSSVNNNNNSNNSRGISTSVEVNSLLDTTYFIVCVDAVIKATPTDHDDHIDHLLKINKFVEAYEYARHHFLQRHQLFEIGRQLLQFLFSQQNYKEVISRLTEILKNDYAEWEKWIFQFDQYKLSDLLVDILPITKNSDSKDNNNIDDKKLQLRIGEQYYELVLLRCLEKDILLFKSAIYKFKGLFRPDVICQATELRYNDWKIHGHLRGVSDKEIRALGDSFGLLLRLNNQNDKALQILMQVDQSDELFEFIRINKLFTKAMEILPELFARNEDKTIELLLDQYKEHDMNNSIDDDEELKDISTTTKTKKEIIESPFTPVAIVQRLERTQRRYLWSYLKALQINDKLSYASLLKTRAQLIAALYIENEPSGLLAFLQKHFMYLPKLKDIYALCKKHQLLEETVFLLAKMGKEEEGLRIIVHEMKNMKKAVQFIADIPSEDDQLDLYNKLIHMTLEVNSSLPSQRGQKYLEHHIKDGETWNSIAKKYDIEEKQLYMANFTGRIVSNNDGNNNNNNLGLPNGICIVPLNLIQGLLQAVVDPSINGKAILDPVSLIKLLPEDEPLPNMGSCIATVSRSKANDVKFMETVLKVATSDLKKQYDTLYRRRVAAIEVEPGVSICFLCHQPVTVAIVVFGCSHTYHASCIINYLAGANALIIQPNEIDIDRFFKRPHEFLKIQAQQNSPKCLVCNKLHDTIK